MTIHRRQRLALPEEVTVLHRMKTIRTIGLAAVLGVMAAPGSPAEPPDTAVSAQPPHRIYGLAWSALEYPPLACPWGEGHSTRAELVLRDWPGQRCATNGFSLHLWLSQRYDGRTGVVSGSTAFPREGEIQCRLHRGDGTVAAAMNDPLTMGFMVGDLGTESGYVDCDLSWGTNEMDEAWIELQFPGYRYWLEVPYGFTHDSRNDRAARAPEPVRSALPTALAQRGTNDYVIPWQTYQCELDNRTDARVSLRWPRAEPATCTVELYRESGPWSPRSPVVAVDLRVPGQPLFSATRYSTTLPDEYRRDDAFRFDTAAWPRGRFRGEMHVMLDSRDYPVLLPGSVVGTGETATVSARLPPPWEPRAAPPDWPTITEALAAIQHQDRGLATGAEALRPIVAQAAKLLGADWPLVWSAMQRQRWDECQDCGCRPNDEHKVSLPPLRTATSNQPDFFLDCHVTCGRTRSATGRTRSTRPCATVPRSACSIPQ